MQTDLGQLTQLSTLSYTTLSELERCGYRYYLERTLGFAERHPERRAGSAPRGVDARARGTLVHTLLEAYDFARPAAPRTEEVARVARALGMRLSGDELEQIASLLGALSGSAREGAGGTQPSPAARVAAAVSVRREHPFTFSTGPEDPLITGVIDLLARESNGNCLVLDYKTDRVRDGEDLVLLVERDYGLQRLLYALAVLRDGAPSVEIVHWFLERPHDWVSARYAMADRSALEQELVARVARARASAFRVSDRPHRGLCETCPGRGGLCSWSDAETLREQPLQTAPGEGG
jgi:RecB family exonuclease